VLRTAADDNERAKGLLNLTAIGDEAAYTQLFELMSGRVFAFVRRMVRDEALSDELMVDTMVEVWKTAGRFRGDAKVSTWILGIARFKALMALRGLREAPMSIDIEDVADVLESDAPDGFAELDAKQQNEVIARCIDKLSDKHKECIHLMHYEEMSLAEIAVVLAVPEGTVKSRLSIARNQLAQCVAVHLH
jgi:RNA polymerase sigma-70 factor, ECF subfamily